MLKLKQANDDLNQGSKDIGCSILNSARWYNFRTIPDEIRSTDESFKMVQSNDLIKVFLDGDRPIQNVAVLKIFDRRTFQEQNFEVF